MKKLITAVDVKNYSEQNKKVIYVEPKSIITPAARDEAAELGIEFVVGSKPPVPVSPTCNNQELMAVESLIARIVAEVTARMNFQQQKSLIKEIDQSGLCLVRGDSVVLEDCPSANCKDKVKIKEIVSLKECPMAAGFIEIDAATFSNRPQYDQMCYLLQGSLTCEVSSNKYQGKAGDTFFIPAYQEVTYSTQDKAKLFFVARPSGKK